MSIYLGHCINDELSDDDDMTRKRNKVYAQGNALIRKFYICTDNLKIALITDVNHYENYVMPIAIFFVNSLTKLGIVVQSACLPRDNYRLVKC